MSTVRKQKPTTFTLDAETMADLKAQAAADGRSMSSMIRVLVARNKPKPFSTSKFLQEYGDDEVPDPTCALCDEGTTHEH